MSWPDFVPTEPLTDTISRGLGDVARGLDNGADALQAKFVQSLEAYVPTTVKQYMQQVSPAPKGTMVAPSLAAMPKAVRRTPAAKAISAPPDTSLLQEAVAGVFGGIRFAFSYCPGLQGFDVIDALTAAFPDSPDTRLGLLDLVARLCGEGDTPRGELDAAACLSLIEASYRQIDLSDLPRGTTLSLNLTSGFMLGVQKGLMTSLTIDEFNAFVAAANDPVSALELDSGLILGLVAGVLYGIVEDLLTMFAILAVLVVTAPFFLPVLVLLALLVGMLCMMAVAYVEYQLAGRALRYTASPEAFMADVATLQEAIEACCKRLGAELSGELASGYAAVETSLRNGFSFLVYVTTAPDALLAEGKELGAEIGIAGGQICKSMLERNAFFNTGFAIGYNSGYIIYIVASMFVGYGDVFEAGKGGVAVVRKLVVGGSEVLLPKAAAIGRKLAAGRLGSALLGLLEQAQRLRRPIAALAAADAVPESIVKALAHPVPGSKVVPPSVWRLAPPPTPPRLLTDARALERPSAVTVERGLGASARGTAESAVAARKLEAPVEAAARGGAGQAPQVAAKTLIEPGAHATEIAARETADSVATISRRDLDVEEALTRIEDPQWPVPWRSPEAPSGVSASPRAVARPDRGIEGTGLLDESAIQASHLMATPEDVFPNWTTGPLTLWDHADEFVGLAPATRIERIGIFKDTAYRDLASAPHSWTERDIRAEAQAFSVLYKQSQAKNLLGWINGSFRRLSPVTQVKARQRLGYRIPGGAWRRKLYQQWEDWGIAKLTDDGWTFFDVKLGMSFPEDEIDIGHVVAAVLHHDMLRAVLRKGPESADEKELIRRQCVHAFNYDFANYLPQHSPRNRSAGSKMGARYDDDRQKSVLEVMDHPDLADQLDWAVRLESSLPRQMKPRRHEPQ